MSKWKLRPQYSGPLSHKFWMAIKAIKDQAAHDEAYIVGCLLQNFEEDALRFIEMFRTKRGPT